MPIACPGGCRRAVTVAVGLILLVLGGCSKAENPPAKRPQPQSAEPGPLAGAPQDWRVFLEWAEAKLKKAAAGVPLPASPRLPEPKWPVLHLDEMLGDAEVMCVWQPAMTTHDPLLTLGPFRSDRPRPDFQVRQDADDALGPGLLMRITGFQVQREDVGSIAIEARVPYGRHFDLVWSGGGKIRVPFPDNQKVWPLEVATDGFVDWSGSLSEIRLRSDGLGEGHVEIRSLRFLPRQDAFPQPTGARRVRVGYENRNAVYVHCPASVKFVALTLPERAKLQVGLGHVPADEARGGSAEDGAAGVTEFEVLVEHSGQQTAVLKHRLQPGARWADVSAGLETWGGQTVSVTLTAVSGTLGSVALWANPLVYQPEQDAPCVVLYLIDALAGKHLDVYGYARPTAPNIKALASEGVWFPHTFCNSPVTVASVPDILLSMPTERHGVYAASITVPLELVSLADALRGAGFATALFSTNAHAGPRQNTDQGFDHFMHRLGPGWRGHPDRTVPLDDVHHWLEVHRDRPTFLYIHTAEPHAPYTPPPDFVGRFDPDYTGFADGTFDAGGPRGFSVASRERDVEHLRALYDEEVLYADMRFGRFLELLEELEIRSRANVFVIADHGEELLEHGHWGHGRSLHTEVLHIPLVIAGPLVTARGKQEVPAQLHDIMPTLLDLFGLPDPYELEGTSLRPFLQADAAGGRDAFDRRIIFHSHHRYFGTGVVEYAVIDSARWKLMYSFDAEAQERGEKPTSFALYDLRDYFYDREDVIDKHPDVARRLVGELLAYRQRQHPYDTTLSDRVLRLDAEQIRDLRALGYIGGEEDEDD